VTPNLEEWPPSAESDSSDEERSCSESIVSSRVSAATRSKLNVGERLTAAVIVEFENRMKEVAIGRLADRTGKVG
jgi:hypothetical protein